MKSTIINTLVMCLLSVSPLFVNAQEGMPSQELQEARSLVKVFGSDLKSVLTTAMMAGGPIEALEVCNLEAGPIAEKNSSLQGWSIARTSMKVRNEDNTADEWEANILQQFEERKVAGEDVQTMEHSEVVTIGQQSVMRYMKPIPTDGLCMTCHGVNLTDQISNKVESLYPNDQATGFNVGDIRGAFTLRKTNY